MAEELLSGSFSQDGKLAFTNCFCTAPSEDAASVRKRRIFSADMIRKEGIKMIQTTVEVGGMACSMCEAHINDAIRKEFPVEKVSSSHAKGKTVILSKEPLNENALRNTIAATGYRVGEIHCEPYEKKGLFSFLKKN